MKNKKRVINLKLLEVIIIIFMSFFVYAVANFIINCYVTNEVNKQLSIENKQNQNIIYDNEDTLNKSLEKKVYLLQTKMEIVKDALVVDESQMTLTLTKEKLLDFNITSMNVNEVFLEPKWGENEIIAVNNDTNEIINSDEIANKTIVVPYTENGLRVVFCGKYNEKFHWDDTCVLNVYKNDILVNITEANYDDGRLINYKQAFLDDGVWYTSRRYVVGVEDGININAGETWKYKQISKIQMNFSFEEATSNDMLTVDALRLRENTGLLEYYSGNTWNGKYNDKSDDALFIKYNEDGTVKTLYKGGFINGLFHDESGKAWEIAELNDTNQYYYYTGAFIHGKRPRHEITQKPLMEEEIINLLESNQLNLDLLWRQ